MPTATFTTPGHSLRQEERQREATPSSGALVFCLLHVRLVRQGGTERNDREMPDTTDNV